MVSWGHFSLLPLPHMPPSTFPTTLILQEIPIPNPNPNPNPNQTPFYFLFINYIFIHLFVLFTSINSTPSISLLPVLLSPFFSPVVLQHLSSFLYHLSSFISKPSIVHIWVHLSSLYISSFYLFSCFCFGSSVFSLNSCSVYRC